MKKILILIYIFSGSFLMSQDLVIENNPFDQAPENVKQKKAFQREKYFYEQRMYPNNFIPKDAYAKAYEQREALRIQNGFAMRGTFDTWTNIGPTTGFYFGYSNISSRITTAQYDPNNGNTIYLGTANGGVWKSVDGGATWNSKSDFENSLSSGSISIDPSNSNIIYYGTGEATYSGASYFGRGVLKSTNGGDTWTNYTAGLPSSSYTSRIVIRPNNTSQLLAAMGNNGLYRSTDAGVSWSQLLSGRCDDVIFSPSGDSAYIVGTGTGYRVSINGGSTFSVNASLPMGANRNHISICKSNPNILYSATYDGASTIRVYKSVNHGLTFSQIVVGQNFSGGQAWYDFYMHVNPFDANNAFVGSIDIWRTTDGGATNFSNITNGYSGGNVHVDQQNFAFHPSDANQMICVNDGGVWRSTNKGSSWINMNTNLTLTQFYRIASDPSNASHVLGGTQDNGTQRTLGSLNWAAAFGGDGGEVCFHSQNNSYILGESQNNGLVRSSNGGSSWASATGGISGSASWVAPILSHPSTAGIFYTARQQVFRTSNWGENWSAISSGTGGVIREMAISKTDPNIMYATSGGTIYKSVNAGSTYASVTNGLPGSTITSVNVHGDSSQVALITFSGFGIGHIYKTINGGTSWVNISGNLPDSPANDALIIKLSTGEYLYYIATDIGVFVTTDFGQSWVELAGGLPNTVAMHLDYHQTTNNLRVGTHGRGVWEITPAPALSAAPCENFTTITFPPPSFNVEYSGTNYWSRQTYSAYGTGSGSTKFDFYSAVQGTVQSLVSNNFIATDANSYLTFDEAYAPYSVSTFGPDTLAIEVSNNSGSTYSVLATLTGKYDGTGELNTAPPNVNSYTPANSEWRPKIYSLPSGTNKIRLKAKSGFGNNLYIDNICVKVLPAPISSSIGIASQGMWLPSPPYWRLLDTVRVYLHRSDLPGVVVDSAKMPVNTTTAVVNGLMFNKALNGNYYRVVKHRNMLETWSNVGFAYTRGGASHYNFITDGMAYGNNQAVVNVSPLYRGMFSGDVNQDDVIDVNDLAIIDNDAYNFVGGYVVTDLNGDNVTDILDLATADDNAFNFVARVAPPGAEPLVSQSNEKNDSPVFNNAFEKQKYELSKQKFHEMGLDKVKTGTKTETNINILETIRKRSETAEKKKQSIPANDNTRQNKNTNKNNIPNNVGEK